VRGYTIYTINAFKHLGAAHVTEVQLEFGVSISGKSGLPYIASGTAASNVKISVKCEFPPAPTPVESCRPPSVIP
jgi:hypothetical protein